MTLLVLRITYEDFISTNFVIYMFYMSGMTLEYDPAHLERYKESLHKYFGQITTIVSQDCPILCNLVVLLSKNLGAWREHSKLQACRFHSNQTLPDFTYQHFHPEEGKWAAVCWQHESKRTAEMKHVNKVASPKIPAILSQSSIGLDLWSSWETKERFLELRVLRCSIFYQSQYTGLDWFTLLWLREPKKVWEEYTVSMSQYITAYLALRYCRIARFFPQKP